MRLDKEIFLRGLCGSRNEAQELILNDKVLVNNVVVNKPAKEVLSSDEILIIEKRKYVSRGGEKLEGIFKDIFGDEEKIKSIVSDQVALDVGSSTGGFSDFLIQNGIKEVDAVDIGTEQFHNSLRHNKKINLFENTDIRNFENKKEYSFIVADLSFISLFLIIKRLFDLGTKNKTKYFILIKPQFEVGKGNTKKGIVKDKNLVDEVLNNIKNELNDLNLKAIKIFPCHIKGGDGNQEYFIYCEK